jgi:hypothetical protein
MVDAPLKALPLGYNVEVISLPTDLENVIGIISQQTGNPSIIAIR